MIEGQSHYTKHDKCQPHSSTETFTELSHSSRIMGKADLPATLYHPDSSESVTAGRNNSTKMFDHDSSKSLTCIVTNGFIQPYLQKRNIHLVDNTAEHL